MGANGAFCAEPEAWSAAAERRARLSAWFRVSVPRISMQHSRHPDMQSVWGTRHASRVCSFEERTWEPAMLGGLLD